MHDRRLTLSSIRTAFSPKSAKLAAVAAVVAGSALAVAALTGAAAAPACPAHLGDLARAAPPEVTHLARATPPEAAHLAQAAPGQAGPAADPALPLEGRTAVLAGDPAQPAPQQIARNMLRSYGWTPRQFKYLNWLWTAESNWSVSAVNPSTGAYGIAQAVPGAKMAGAGPDWQADAATQIRWGLTYIAAFYGSPRAAWEHEAADGWY